ncbi:MULTISPECIES: DUF4184 family protein [Myxococcaceae]|uniref:DUF4184 family protein n=1 Tax=Myxococcaceae TaxID=31 RepID=UPI00188E4BDC|nr:DUF4184 family protein [Simulacricoccus sp. 17bor-14]
MPITLPAHPAAVLPLLRYRRWLPPTALVVGACVPDLHYVLRMGSEVSHSLHGLFLFCLPVGLATLLWLELLVLPVLRRTLPEVGGVQPARFLAGDGLPRGLRGWALVLLALLLGALTHLLWDGFTHDLQWPARALYRFHIVRVAGRNYTLAHLLQYLTSLLGSLVVLAAMVRAYPRLPPAPGAPWGRFLPVLLATVLGGVWMLGLRLPHVQHVHGYRVLVWHLFWPALTGALVGLTLACAWLRPRLEPA